MKKFDFGDSIIEQIINEIGKAKSYIKIVVFQIHNENLINLLIEKVKEGVTVEIITLPYESIYLDIRERVTQKLQELKNLGGAIHFCDWNVGDTSITKTVTGTWYPLHAKFMVTDKSAMIFSANLTEGPEIDAILINDDNFKIEEFNKQFNLIKEYYIDEKIVEKIKEKVPDNQFYEIFNPPKDIKVSFCNNYPDVKKSILHYPLQLCPDVTEIEERLYIHPFDCKGRAFVIRIIEEAEEFVYISSERFTDEDFVYFLEQIKSDKGGLKVKILAKFQSQDYQYRNIRYAKDLLALGIEYNTLEDLHAKLIITDKLVALGSINLNSMNLGFLKEKVFWRANTEAMIVCKDKKIIAESKKKFEDVFSGNLQYFKKKPYSVQNKLIDKETDYIKKVFWKVLNEKPIPYKVTEFLAKKYVENDIKVRKKIFEIIKETRRLKISKGLDKINKELVKEAERNLDEP